nr:hypothetical protein GCM10020093_062300 [Planobispora longispora]
MVVDLAAVHDRGPLVEQPGDGADEPGLALAALAQQDEVVPGEKRPLQLGQDGVVEADDAREPRLPRPEAGQEVLADLGLDGAVDMATRAKLAQSLWLWDVPWLWNVRHGNETTSPEAKPAASSLSSPSSRFRILTIA